MQSVGLSSISVWPFEDTFENTQRRKVEQMQPNASSWESTFENTCGEKSNTCDQCDFASSNAGNLNMQHGEK